MSSDYIPRPDARFHVRQSNFVTYVNGHLADLGLAAGDFVDLDNSAATWRTDYPGHTAAHAARQAKDAARDGLEGAIRPLVRRLQVSPDVDDSQRAANHRKTAISNAVAAESASRRSGRPARWARAGTRKAVFD